MQRLKKTELYSVYIWNRILVKMILGGITKYVNGTLFIPREPIFMDFNFYPHTNRANVYSLLYPLIL